MKQTIHSKIGLKVNTTEGKTSGALHYKAQKPGRLQQTRYDDSRTYGQLQTKVWDPGR